MECSEWLKENPLPEMLNLRVTPKAKHERIVIEIADDGSTLWRVYVNTPPEDGKANHAVIALLAKTLSLPKSAFTLTHGHTSREKRMTITR